MFLVDVGMFGLFNVGKLIFICSVLVVKLKVVDYLFIMFVLSLGVVCVGLDWSFVVVDILGLIEGVVDGVGLGICFLKYLECCCILIYFVDIMLIDESDLVDNVVIIESELFKYSEKLVEKLIWLVFNKIDMMSEKEV